MFTGISLYLARLLNLLQKGECIMTTLITGATSGIGESLAKHTQIIMSMRLHAAEYRKLVKLSQYQNIESCQFDATDSGYVRAQSPIHTRSCHSKCRQL